MSRPLSPEAAEGIIALRGLLEEALARTSDPTIIGRRVGAVLLDGAAEASIALGLASFNEVPKANGSLEDAYRRLVNRATASGSLSSETGIPGWPEVQRLRRVRNDAQHHQIPPDHQTLARWGGSVQRFVDSIVTLSYNVPLALLSRAHVLLDGELRDGIHAAERHLDAGELDECIEVLRDTFTAARHQWGRDHADATRASIPSRPVFSGGFGIQVAVDAATKPLEDQLDTRSPLAKAREALD